MSVSVVLRWVAVLLAALVCAVVIGVMVVERGPGLPAMLLMNLGGVVLGIAVTLAYFISSADTRWRSLKEGTPAHEVAASFRDRNRNNAGSRPCP